MKLTIQKYWDVTQDFTDCCQILDRTNNEEPHLENFTWS
jgi:hypothetical protein